MPLECFTIFSTSGLVLWERRFNAAGVLKGDPINMLIQNVLLQQRGASTRRFQDDVHELNWRVHQNLGLYFVSVHSKALQLSWIDHLLHLCQEVFLKKHGEAVQDFSGEALDFDEEFTNLLAIAATQKRSARRQMRTFSQTDKGRAVAEDSPSRAVGKKKKKKKKKKKGGNATRNDDIGSDSDSEGVRSDSDSGQAGNDGDAPNNGVDSPASAAASPASPNSFMGMTRRKKRSGPGGFKGKKGASKGGTQSKTTDASGSPRGHWRAGFVNPNKKLSKKERERREKMLSYEVEVSAEEKKRQHDLKLEEFRAKYLGDDDDGWDADITSGGESKAGGTGGNQGGWFSSVSSGALKSLQSITSRVSGNATISSEDLNAPIAALRDHLVRKNVARNVADDIVGAVAESLEGQQLSTFERVQSVVKDTLEEGVGRILTPKRELDLMREVQAARARGEPYTIVFIGINGVGKSTSLAKVCYHLMQRDCNPLIAACDTFRSGAVEQLKVHADCLGVQVFEQGYSSDSAKVAKAAISHAKAHGNDVVLIDTAGRMQNNKGHMIALSAVITTNNPDLILFVGEALTGNDAIDQLQHFNQALVDHARSKSPRLIDGIVLTKFDTVDDKVGTAVSMVHQTGRPIMFVGTGQKYTHLRKLNVEDVLRKLFR